MKVYELFEAVQGSPGQGGKLKSGAYYKPKYDNEKGQIRGSVKDWMDAFGFKPEDVAQAVTEIKSSAIFKKLEDAGLTYDSGKTQEKLGTLSFASTRKGSGGVDYKGGYIVYANGQLRSKTEGAWDKDYTTPLKTPKPKIVAGNPVKSIVMIYTAALTEVLAKWNKYKSKN